MERERKFVPIDSLIYLICNVSPPACPPAAGFARAAELAEILSFSFAAETPANENFQPLCGKNSKWND
jgi:hypothetical protein